MTWIDDTEDCLIFFTRLPLKRRSGLAQRPLADAVRGFAAAGAVIGLAMALVWLIAATILPPGVLPVIAMMAAGYMLTGALHEDGLADIADGFGGGTTIERKLAIMRDSRIGTFGVLALIAVQAALLAAYAELSLYLPAAGFAAIVVTVQAASRAAIPLAMRLMPRVRSDGRSHEAGQPEWRGIAEGAGLVAILVAVSAWICGLWPVVILLPLGTLVGYGAIHAVAMRHLAGQTGDVLGAIQQISALFALLAVLTATI